MGNSFDINCHNCSYKKHFNIGIGMMYSVDNIFNFKKKDSLIYDLIKSEKILNEVKSIIENKNPIIHNKYGHQIYKCKECNDLYNLFYFRLEYDKDYYEPEYKCKKCNSNLEIINEENDSDDINLKGILCPRCGNDSLYFGPEHILWD